MRFFYGSACPSPLVNAGGGRLAWLLEWLPGQPLAQLLAELGGVMVGALAGALEGFAHPAAARPGFKWDLAGAGWAAAEVGAVADPAARARAWRASSPSSRAGVLPAWGALRRARGSTATLTITI